MKSNVGRVPLLLRTIRGQRCGFHRSVHPIQMLCRYPISRFLRAPTLTYQFSSNPIFKPSNCVFFTSSIDTPADGRSDEEHEFDSDDVDDAVVSEIGGNPGDPVSSSDLQSILGILRTGGVQERSINLQQCQATVTPALVNNVIWATRNDWETAFTFFLWAGKQPGYNHSLPQYHSMIAILAKFRKFDTAWSLINEMQSASIATPRTLSIMIRRYAAVHDVAKAISAFYAHRRFNFEMGMKEFQGLLSALCRYKNAKDAEHLMFCNESVFPLNTKSFNIVLNGWCNVIRSVREGQRIWKLMEARGIEQDVYSYASIMSCHSKMNYPKAVLKLYERMKDLGMKPDRKVYNAVIHALAKCRLVEEARNLVKTMEEEGHRPDTITYNSLIMPLCKSKLLDEANRTLDEMLERNLRPTDRTYHAFFRVLPTDQEVFELLERMRKTGCNPTHDTYIMLIRKFSRWRQIDTVFKLWGEMKKNGVDPDRSSYTALIQGLFLNGRLEEAHKYYLEMKEKDFLPDPSIESMIEAWVEGKKDGNEVVLKDGEAPRWDPGEKKRVNLGKKHRDNEYLRQPELRNVKRERGFSFWEN